MTKLFLDTNVILDFILEREGADDATDILQLAEDKQIELAVSFLIMANTAYVVRKGHTQGELYGILSDLSDMLEILPMDQTQFTNALARPANDFEDVLQYECAKACGCEAIITRNRKHFSFAELPVLTPAEFLQQTQS
ncbi:MAG: PIN domain-containing protein [Candidatus Bacteroides intestinipullorum]|uniref:PIN domain-containing protein n=1 Tax=Candidatus Bacteroides intestinipullorum TaxID=2838471 RepID=A0A9E2NMN9_9BACE|nr:PIN domain-containing protein [Candidatus Bacteroides intestinipullorum]